jgi:L-2,4-diaminobutyrate decarboxylase
MPALATGVLFRRVETAYATFAQKAAYLFEERAEPPWFDIGLRTVECTKPLIALTLYGALATLGTQVFADAIEHAYDLARAFAGRLAAEPDFTVACPPDANIVCFRYVPEGKGEAELDDLQRRVRDELRERGAFYCVLTTLRGSVYLRVTLMNPKTSLADLEALIAAIRRAGAP